MSIFSRHKLVITDSGYTLLLYVDKHRGEFAEDFFSNLDSRRRKVQQDSLSSIKKYIDENLGGIKIDAVNIMLGSLLVASIAYSSVGANVTTLPSSKKVQQAKNTAASAPQAVDKNIMLVNKKRSLSSAYKPNHLVVPNVSKTSSAKTMMTPDAAKALEALFAKAKQDNIKLTAVSGYRSYEKQSTIFASNINKYGSAAAANQFSAKAGQSEHQTGLAMDVSSPSVNFKLTQSYANTREGKWLAENAPQFGFIVRYPKGKEKITGYQFEPWHIRYVGKAAAIEITSRNITLEEYLGEA